MARNTARAGRRRRVLNEEVLSASNIAVRSGSTTETIEPGDTPRYGAGANIENHPQVTSFVPRRYRTLSLIAICGLGIATSAEVAAHYAEPISEFLQVVTPAEITEVFSNRLVAWTAATLLLLAAANTMLIYSLRRHRVDDNRGSYRVWRTAGWTALALSMNAVLGGHEILARVLGNTIDYQVLPNSAGWWLAPAAILGSWLLVKLVLDVAECRGAMAVFLLAITCLTVAGVHSAGWSPEWAAAWPGVLSRALPLAGYTFLLVGSQLFARYVILDVQGLVDHADANVSSVADEQAAQIEIEARPEQQAVAEITESTAWVDGSEPELDYGDEPNKKLSKAERKRLRKQKQRRAA